MPISPHSGLPPFYKADFRSGSCRIDADQSRRKAGFAYRAAHPCFLLDALAEADVVTAPATRDLRNKEFLAISPGRMSAKGLVSRASPVQTAVRNCTRDEGGPFGFGDQVADPKPPQAAVVKSHGGERCGNVGTMIPAGTVERGERKRTVSEVSKAD